MPSPGTACGPEVEGWGVGIFTYGGGLSPSANPRITITAAGVTLTGQ